MKANDKEERTSRRFPVWGSAVSLVVMAALFLILALRTSYDGSLFYIFVGFALAVAVAALYSFVEVRRVVLVRRRHPGSVVSGFTTFPELIDELGAVRVALSSQNTVTGAVRYPFHYVLVIGPSEAVIYGGLLAGKVKWKLDRSQFERIDAGQTQQGGFRLNCLSMSIATSKGTKTCDFCLTDVRTVFPAVAGSRYHKWIASRVNEAMSAK